MTWQLKRNDTQETVSLPEDMHWADEFDWNKIAQAPPERSLSGSNFIFQSTKKEGRPITITTGDWAWLEHSLINTLRNWTDVSKLQMTLTHYDGREFQVIWRLHDTAITAEPVHYQTPESDDDPYTATLRLMTV